MAEIRTEMDLPQPQSRLDFTGASIAQDCTTKSKDGIGQGTAPDIVLPHQEADFVRHIAIDIGGSLIKLVYFSPEDDDESFEAVESDESSPDSGSHPSQEAGSFTGTLAQFEQSPVAAGLMPPTFPDGHQHPATPKSGPISSNSGGVGRLRGQMTGDVQAAGGQCDTAGCMSPLVTPSQPAKGFMSQTDQGDPESAQTLPSRLSQQSLGMASEKAARGGRLHFVKFETHNIEDAIRFIEQKQLLRRRSNNGEAMAPMQVRATGGGAFKYADLFRERLGVVLCKEDEMACLVEGCSFLLKAIRCEAFEFQGGEYAFKSAATDLAPLYPYLLVNIGSGVSMIKVDGGGACERVSGTNLGGGTFWGLCRLLTRVRSFDELLRLSSRGDSGRVDMLVGDIYGNTDPEALGLSAETLASSFGRVVSQDLELEDYNPADIALAVCRMVSYNIGHLAFLNAKKYGLTRLLFGGFFTRGHPDTMNFISYAIRFWSKGEMRATFLRHEGFLGAMGAFLKGHPLRLPRGTTAAAADAGAAQDLRQSTPPMVGQLGGPPGPEDSERSVQVPGAEARDDQDAARRGAAVQREALRLHVLV